MAATAAELVSELDREFEAFSWRAAAAGPALDAPNYAGWSGKEMVAHVAFWMEAAVPVIRYMLRGKEIPMPWAFGSGDFNEQSWPNADVHNAREAAWARGQSVGTVLERLAKAHAALRVELLTLTLEELERDRNYHGEILGHLGEHAGEMSGLG